MASGKRASMREGPLAALFRRTDEDVPEGTQSTPEAQAPETATPAAPEPAQPQAAAPQAPAAPPEPLGEAAIPPTTAAPAPRRREPDPLRDSGPAASPPPHPRETGYPHPSLSAEGEARRAPSAQERLRNAFSTELPDDIL